MTKVKWIKIVTDIFNDEKILLIDSLPESDTILVIWFKLLCLAGKQNNGGVITMNDKIAYTDEMLATIFRRNLNTVRLALKTFEEFGMIEIINGVICIPNWSKHQNVESMDKIREQTRKRVAKYRQNHALIGKVDECNVTETLPVTLGNETDIEEETEQIEETDKREESREKKEERRKEKEETNIRPSDDAQMSLSQLETNFERCWSEYPRKCGKKKAFEAFKRSIKHGATVEEILIGIRYYNEDIDRKQLPEKYIKMGSTFFQGECWTDEYGVYLNKPDYSKEKSDVDDLDDIQI